MVRFLAVFLCLVIVPLSVRSEVLEELETVDSFRIMNEGWLSSLVGTQFEFLESPVSVAAKDNKLYFIDDVLMGLYVYDMASQQASNLKSVYKNLDRNSARLFVTDDQTLFVIDSFGSQVSKYSLSGSLITRFYDALNLNVPVDMCINPANQHVFIADAFFGHIIEFSATGDPLALHGIKEAGGTQAGRDIVGMACTEDELFIVSKLSKNINVFSFSGKLLRQITYLEIRSPSSIAVDSYGRVYVSDDFNDQIVIYGRDGGQLERFGRSGLGGGGTHFRKIKDLSIDGDYLYVADNLNRSIKIFIIHPPKESVVN